ncbi:hypothetical protein [Thalassobellus citreus]|uniref:hypothetical protein n=1 Tax=Thalassobellus citreus TaxID=3367752 RepID=UPI0037A7150D
MNEIKQKLAEKKDSKAEIVWIYFWQLLGVILFIAPLFLPVKAWFIESKEPVPITFFGGCIVVVGFFIARGGSAVGTVTNNIGIIIVDFLKRISNTK